MEEFSISTTLPYQTKLLWHMPVLFLSLAQSARKSVQMIDILKVQAYASLPSARSPSPRCTPLRGSLSQSSKQIISKDPFISLLLSLSSKLALIERRSDPLSASVIRRVFRCSKDSCIRSLSATPTRHRLR